MAAEESRLTAVHQGLVIEYWPYIQGVARAFSRTYGDHDIFLDACVIAACRTASRWDAAKGASFKTLLDHRLKGACVDALIVRTRTRSREQSIEDAGAEFVDPKSFTPARDIEFTDTFSQILAGLAAIEQLVIRSVYLDGLNFSQTARHLGVSASWVRTVHNTVITEIQGYMAA